MINDCFTVVAPSAPRDVEEGGVDDQLVELAVGDEGGAAHFAEHAGHLGGELHLGTLAHLSRGAGVSHRGLVLAQDDLAALALRCYSATVRFGVSETLENELYII